jgi:hypothetical protein
LPTVLRSGPYRFFFYSNEGGEPAHIHVQRDDQLAKFWVQTVALAASTGFPAHELRKLEGMVRDKQQRFLEAWDEYFGSSD